LQRVGQPKILLDPAKKDQKGYTNSGTLTVPDIIFLQENPTFLDVRLLDIRFLCSNNSETLTFSM